MSIPVLLVPIERFCTCCNTIEDKNNSSRQLPEAVELLWCINSDNQNEVSPVFTVSRDENDTTQQKLLMQNFETYGWSPIRIRWHESKQELLSLSDKSKIHSMSVDAYILLQQSHLWKRLHDELFHFHDDNNNNNHINSVDTMISTSDYDDTTTDGVLRYVPFESGTSGASTPEAKVSWEYQRRRRHHPTCVSPTEVHKSNANIPTTPVFPVDREQTRVKLRLHAWTEILHTVICHVMEELQLPTEHLISHYNDTDDITNTEQSSKIESSLLHQPLDLLRAFRYDPVSTVVDAVNGTAIDNNNNNNPTQSLGSSPHTDWGSWTVVWQDDDTDPPCLQTYCYHCQKWNSVRSPPVLKLKSDDHTTDTVANFIVHVGDMTSLCIRHAIQRVEVSRKSSSSQLSPAHDVIPDISNIWPSPRHRVISPLHQYRHSLVYFVYPPPDTTTPALITESLHDWCHHHHYCERSSFVVRPTRIPYDDYSLLYDQSASANTNTTSTSTTNTATSRCDETIKCSIPNNEVQWKNIQSVPVRNIFEAKWKQVQR